MDYEDYKNEIITDINSCMDALQVQPILFMGSGISQRYFSAPTWDNLMRHLSTTCPLITRRYEYFQQVNNKDNTKIASDFAESYAEWAWDVENNKRYPDEYFSNDYTRDIYLKHEVCSYLDHLIEGFSIENNEYEYEINELKKTNPHSIITTNYDPLMSIIFPDYHTVIGQEVVRANYSTYGEILKIHGCSSDKQSIVLTEEDYIDFNKKKKYLSAKLLTYFAEHPLFFFGYSITDNNIKGILSDIDEILAPNGELIPNIYIVCHTDQTHALAREQLIAIDENRSVRLKVIFTNDFSWVYSTLSSNTPDVTVNPRLIRALLSKTYKLASSNLPKRELAFNFKMLQDIADDDTTLPTLYGIAEIGDYQIVNAKYIYTITGLSEKLDLKNWHQVNDLMNKIKLITGVSIKDTDNKYHIKVNSGCNSNGAGGIRKYSLDALDLLTKVRNNEPYELNLN